MKIYDPTEKKLKQINLQLKMMYENQLAHPALVCVDEAGNYICTLLYFHMGRGGMHPRDGSKETLEALGYDISNLQFDSQGAIRFKVPEDWGNKNEIK